MKRNKAVAHPLQYSEEHVSKMATIASTFCHMSVARLFNLLSGAVQHNDCE